MKNSRSRHTIHTGVVSTCSWSHIWLVVHGNPLFRLSWPPYERYKKHTHNSAIFQSLDFLGLVEEFENWLMMRANKWYDSSIDFCTALLNEPLVVTHFIKTMELLRVQGPKNNI
jgi:hypothetical protein